jgi:hypothetical protein
MHSTMIKDINERFITGSIVKSIKIIKRTMSPLLIACHNTSDIGIIVLIVILSA